MRVLIISDCSQSQVCGVTRKQNELVKQLRLKNHIPLLLTSDDFWNKNAPYWNNVKLVVISPAAYWKLIITIEKFNPQMINIMTEGPLGLMAGFHCLLKGRPYSTMRCTRFELYFKNPMFSKLVKKYIENFHSFSNVCISPSPSLAKLNNHPNSIGILNGCNITEFNRDGKKHPDLDNLSGPKWLYVGRVEKEKNIQDLLDISDRLKGSVIIVGDGSYVREVQENNHVYFMGWKKGEELVQIYRSCDVFVFPSKTDTFGQVMVEAMACGLPVAAYPVIGPLDVVKHGSTGYLDNDLYKACIMAHKTIDRDKCVEHAKQFSWSDMCDKFIECQVIHQGSSRPHIYIQLLIVFLLIIYLVHIL